MELNQDMLKIINHLLDERNGIKQFKAEIETKKAELATLRDDQAKELNFGRSSKIKELSLAIDNAEDVLKQKIRDYQEDKRVNLIKLSGLTSHDLVLQVYHSEEAKQSLEAFYTAFNTFKEAFQAHIQRIDQLRDDYFTAYEKAGTRLIGADLRSSISDDYLMPRAFKRDTEDLIRLYDSSR